MRTNEDYERIRADHLPPDGVRVLFIGESRPDGSTFFYCGDSLLVKHTACVFSAVYGHEWDPREFPRAFMELGCYLEDLCPEPVNQIKDRKIKRRKHREGIVGLCTRLSEFNPRAIVVVKADIVSCICKAARKAGYPPLDVSVLPTYRHSTPKKYPSCNWSDERRPIPLYALPFPSEQWQLDQQYRQGLSEALITMRRLGTLA